MKKKAKKKSRKQQVSLLDKIFSQWVRLKEANTHGISQCYTCGDFRPRKELQCGHRLSRRYYKYRRDENNAHSQCIKCNIFLNGNQILYTRRIMDELGIDKVDEMIDRSKQVYKISTPEIEEKIQYYKLRVNELLAKLHIDGHQ